MNWNEVSADPSVEPEHPAPVLEITPAAAAKPAATTDVGNASVAAAADAQTSTTGDDASMALPIGLSGAALALSLFAAVLAWRRGRPFEVVASEQAPDRERVEV